MRATSGNADVPVGSGRNGNRCVPRGRENANVDVGVPRVVGAPSVIGAPGEWYSRGYLPHRDRPHLIQSVTYRVHILVEPFTDLATIIQGWKSFTARWILLQNQRLELRIPEGNHLWMREYWDRFIRDAEHYYKTVDYIHENPVKAGLCQRAEDWLWSSCRLATTPENADVVVSSSMKKAMPTGTLALPESHANGDVGAPSHANGDVGAPNHANGDVGAPRHANGDVGAPSHANGDVGAPRNYPTT